MQFLIDAKLVGLFVLDVNHDMALRCFQVPKTHDLLGNNLNVVWVVCLAVVKLKTTSI